MDTSARARTVSTAISETIDIALRGLSERLDVGLAPDPERVDEEQGLLNDLATIAAAHRAGDAALEDPDAADPALLHLSQVAGEAFGRLAPRGVDVQPLIEAMPSIAEGSAVDLRERIVERMMRTGEAGHRFLPDDIELVRQSFRRFADTRVMPVAERIHREDLDVPEDLIAGLAELGGFALSVPAAYGGLVDGGSDAVLSMLVATEELSRASLGAAGSLSTRPEIVAGAIARGGTEEQRLRWLPDIASGARMTSVAVTEPDAGSDVSAVRLTARSAGDDLVLDGVKTWCTFAGRAELLMVLARTESGPSLGHRGLSLVMVEKPARHGRAFELEQPGGGRLTGRAIPTLGYRGMHSFELSFEGWRVPADALIGGQDGRGRGFYLQMEAFANARVQTAARAQGVMQAAIDACLPHTRGRVLFGKPLSELALTREKLALMASRLTVARALTIRTGQLLADGAPAAGLAAAQAKLFAGAAAEWVTREALQLHGGYGYAEESRVSRLYVDARVLSIFEGANEVLALKIIGRGMIEQASRRGRND